MSVECIQIATFSIFIQKEIITATSRLLFRYSKFAPTHRYRFQEVNYLDAMKIFWEHTRKIISLVMKRSALKRKRQRTHT